MNILIVEDDYEDMEYCSRLLSEISPELEFYRCGMGERALHILKSEDIDAVFIDVQLPDFDGFKLASIIRQTEKYQLVPIVFVTGQDSNFAEIHSRYHHYEYVEKPFTSAVFKEKVAPLINGMLYKRERTRHIDEEKGTKLILVDTPCEKLLLSTESILFAEFANRKICLYTERGVYSGIRMGLREFIDYVDEPFFIQTYKSFAANINRVARVRKRDRSAWIVEFDTYDVTGRECLLGKTYYEAVFDKFAERIRKQ